ncbi:sensor histidine kinase [Stackebrandtia nassauensis]|uniref:histidine kinase n=1 Tax=Stackebrandtia nassauensis (strain DSM 44728 / CIP 108903 / NRRL B-16338 / NBRC 102104 / LLR-40K-21) TaxID=446470 RepID=D3Q8S3_STANL|nr:sensor histidine kinase [Stackebrandtia nassauensis]ADD44515.1 histidine kinase [Stackebrandtia nassauensis DSM 44728]
MRRQLAGLVAATTSLVLVALLIPVGLLLRSQAEQRAIAEATLRAQSVAQLVPQLSSDSEALGEGVTVFLPDGTELGDPAPRGDSVKLAQTGRAFTASTPDGVEVLVPTRSSDSGTAVVRVFVGQDRLHQGVTQSIAVLSAIVLVLLGLGILLANRLARRMVSSVDELAGTADRLATGDLTARAALDGPPELRRVAEELNRLAARIGELLTSEREEVADLAHRLRTPLTALRMNIDNLGDTASAAPLRSSVDTLAGHVDELIRTARRPVREGAAPVADLAAVAADRLRFWGALAEDDDRELSGDIPAFPVTVRTNTDDLTAALDALLDNAFRHTPAGSALRIAVSPSGTVTIDDAGPGFRNRALANRGHSGAGSTGLGLDIARRTAAASGGDLHIGTSPWGGARVELRFGPSR